MPIHGKKILIVEDERPLRELLSQKLSSEGCGVLESADGESGLKSALDNHPDLVILNLRLPKIDGIEVLRRLRADTWGKAVPVVILTVLDVSDEMLKEIVAHQPSYYFVKSDWKLEEVIEKIKEVLE